MHANTSKVTQAFMAKVAHKTVARTATDGVRLTLWDNTIAEHRPDGLWITTAGWPTRLTMDRLNNIPGLSLYSQKNVLYLNGVPWDGSWIRVKNAKGQPLKVRGKGTGADIILGWSGRLASQGAPRGYECGPGSEYSERLDAMYGKKH